MVTRGYSTADAVKVLPRIVVMNNNITAISACGLRPFCGRTAVELTGLVHNGLTRPLGPVHIYHIACLLFSRFLSLHQDGCLLYLSNRILCLFEYSDCLGSLNNLKLKLNTITISSHLS